MTLMPPPVSFTMFGAMCALVVVSGVTKLMPTCAGQPLCVTRIADSDATPFPIETAAPLLLDPNGASGTFVACYSHGKPRIEWDNGAKSWVVTCPPPHGPIPR